MTSGRGDEAYLAAGGPARHVPVLRDEVMAALALREGGLYLDATFGAGGYSTRSARQAQHPRSRARSRPCRNCWRSLARGRSAGAALSCKGAVWQARPGGAPARAFRLRRRCARHRRVVHANRRPGARLFLPRRRPARYAHGRRGDERRRSCQCRRGDNLGQYFLPFRRGACVAPHRPCHRHGPRHGTLSPRLRCSLQ